MHLWKLECFMHTLPVIYRLRKLEYYKHALVEIRVFQAYACGRCCDTETSTSLPMLRTCACAQVRLLPFFLSCHTVVACLCAHSLPARILMSSHPHGSSSMKNIIHFHGSGAFALTHKILALSCRWNKRTSVWGLLRASSMNCRNSYSEFLQDTRRCIKN